MTKKFWLAAVAAAAMAVASTGLRADDEKPKTAAKKADEPTTEAGKKLAEIRKSVDEPLQAAMAAQKAMQSAKDDEKKEKSDEFQKALGEYRKAQSAAGAKYAALVKEFPADPAALEALPMALQMGAGKDRKDLYAIVKEHHLKSPKLGGFVMFLSRDESPESGELLREIAAAATDKTVKGQATLAIGLSLKNQIAGYSSKPTEEQIAKVVPEAEKYLTLAAKEFADVTYGRATVGKTAEKELVGLRNVPNLQIGKVAPDAKCATLEGATAKLSDYRGKVVVVDIWATWCGPCRAMIPHEREMVKHLEGKPFALISVSADDKKETLTTFLEKEPMPWAHWWNGAEGGMLGEWNIQAFPTIYVIDHKGVIRYKNVRDKALEKAVETLLKEIDSPKGAGSN